MVHAQIPELVCGKRHRSCGSCALAHLGVSKNLGHQMWAHIHRIPVLPTPIPSRALTLGNGSILSHVDWHSQRLPGPVYEILRPQGTHIESTQRRKQECHTGLLAPSVTVKQTQQITRLIRAFFACWCGVLRALACIGLSFIYSSVCTHTCMCKYVYTCIYSQVYATYVRTCISSLSLYIYIFEFIYVCV